MTFLVNKDKLVPKNFDFLLVVEITFSFDSIGDVSPEESKVQMHELRHFFVKKQVKYKHILANIYIYMLPRHV